jgi:hypothetical protein
MRILFAVWFFAHGVAHLPGFLVSWQLLSTPSVQYHTALLNNKVDVGSVGIRVVGVVWLLCCLAFIALSIAAMMQGAWWHEVAFVVLGTSLVLCVLGWPRSRIGVASNIVVAALLFLSTRFHWI